MAGLFAIILFAGGTFIRCRCFCSIQRSDGERGVLRRMQDRAGCRPFGAACKQPEAVRCGGIMLRENRLLWTRRERREAPLPCLVKFLPTVRTGSMVRAVLVRASRCCAAHGEHKPPMRTAWASGTRDGTPAITSRLLEDDFHFHAESARLG